ncbi:unnamed protein product [Parajaminaea phylloscopi]
MSFNDLERGTASVSSSDNDAAIRASPRPARPKSATPLPLYHAPGGSSRIAPRDEEDEQSGANTADAQEATEIKGLVDGIGAQIFKVNSNTAAINKLLKLAEDRAYSPSKAGAPPGGEDRDWTKRAHDLVESTRAVVKATTPAIKDLAARVAHKHSAGASQNKVALSKLQRDFESALQAFSIAQKASAKRSKAELAGAKRAIHEQAEVVSTASTSRQTLPTEQLIDVEDRDRREGAAAGTGDQSDGSPQLALQAQQLKAAGPSAADLEFQEALIAEREAEIREIESGVHELNEIFRDLGHIVQEQGGMIDNIEYNIGEIATNTGEADRELVRANDYQRKAGKRAACLLLIVGFVISAVLVAILS